MCPGSWKPQTYDEQRVLKVWADANMYMLSDQVSAGMYALSHTLPDFYNGWAAHDATGAPRLHPDASRRKVASFSARAVEERPIMAFDTAAQVKMPFSFVRRSATQTVKHSSNDPDPAGVPLGYPDGDPVLHQFLDDPECPMGVSAAPAFMINKCRYTGSPMPHMPGRKQHDVRPSVAVTGDNTMGLPTMPIFNCKLHCKPTAVASGYAEYYNVAIVC